MSSSSESTSALGVSSPKTYGHNYWFCVLTAAQSIAYSDAEGADRLQKAIDVIYDVEKKARLGGDLAATRKACIAIVELCHEAGNWKALSENTLIVSKKRAQLKQVCSERSSRSSSSHASEFRLATGTGSTPTHYNVEMSLSRCQV